MSLINREISSVLLPGQVHIKDYWLKKGLVLVFLGGRQVWSKFSPNNILLTATGGPKPNIGPFGSVIGFGTTHGTGTTDRADGGILPRPLSGWRSWVTHYYANSTGGGGFGRICQDTGGGGSVIEGIICSSGMSFLLFGSGGTGQWATGSLSTGRWQSFGGTHDQRTVNVVPALYLDGASVSVTTVTNASGSYNTTPTNLGWGNRASSGDRGWDGLIGLTLFFDGALNAAEHATLSKNPNQIFVSNNSILSLLLLDKNISGGTIYTLSPGGTLTFSGSSTELKTKVLQPGGTITFSNTSPLIKIKTLGLSGLISFSGSSSLTLSNGSTTYTMSPGGTITFSGTNIQAHEKVLQPSGNITFNGTALELKTHAIIPSGSIDFSGTSIEIKNKIIQPTGLITFTGNAVIQGPGSLLGSTKLPLTGVGK
jgi:hypothetical protein